MSKCFRTMRESGRNVMAIVSSMVALVWMATTNAAAHDMTMKTTAKTIQTASLGDTSLYPGVNPVPDIGEAKETEPMSAKSYNDRGVMHSVEGQYDLAIADFNKALEIDPMSAETYNNRGITYSKKGQYDLAFADFTRALEIKPEDAEVYFNRGITYTMKGEFDLALSDFKRSVEIRPIDALTYEIMGIVHMEIACSDWKQACNFGNCDHLKEAVRVGLCAETNWNSTFSP